VSSCIFEQKELENRISMGESSRRNLWKRNRRSTWEGGNSKLLCNIQQDTKKRNKKRYPERKHKKMQSQWEETTKGAITKEFFPNVERRPAVILNLSPNITTIMTKAMETFDLTYTD